jgi:SCP-2 sterol transfer family protein
VAVFATSEWIEELADRATKVEVDPTLDLTIEQRIVGTLAATWHISVAGGRLVVSVGENAGATIRLSSDRPTAEAIHAGHLSAERAFLDGALRIGGDIRQLIVNGAALALVAGLLADIT